MKNLYPRLQPARTSFLFLSLILLSACFDNEDALVPSSASASKIHQMTAPDNSITNMNHGAEVFTAHLNGMNELPAVQTRATGQAIFQVSSDGLSMSFKLIVANIKGVTQAHIHCGSATVNGPVVVFLYGFNTEGANVNGVLAEGTITAADVIARPDSEVCMGGVADFNALLDKMRNGHAYVNVHTLTYPGGEIRGQVK
jgi:hypothetical protein